MIGLFPLRDRPSDFFGDDRGNLALDLSWEVSACTRFRPSAPSSSSFRLFRSNRFSRSICLLLSFKKLLVFFGFPRPINPFPTVGFAIGFEVKLLPKFFMKFDGSSIEVSGRVELLKAPIECDVFFGDALRDLVLVGDGIFPVGLSNSC